MKTRKLMLPMMAFICAIGMAFTSADVVEDQSTGYIFRNDAWQPVTVDCGDGELNCEVKFSQNGQEYPVFESDLETMRTGGATEAILINP
ncbi:DUF6520 family protein [Autumnicola musiva]|uniref:DUF6520 family protein n=1 Tax=Autumnicola musiva TaxID=3075589 RepID=A0ABU3D7P5_9FLAO|nr:DUF6520 family protein [Zunongwangia sp. F117]MDT0677028.1 DUF6520 family protein [Zunongwangia sp. F117]